MKVVLITAVRLLLCVHFEFGTLVVPKNAEA